MTTTQFLSRDRLEDIDAGGLYCVACGKEFKDSDKILYIGNDKYRHVRCRTKKEGE